MNFIQTVSYIKEWKANINFSFLLESSNGSQRMAKLHISIREITMCHFDVFMIDDMSSTSVWLPIFFRSFIAFSFWLTLKPFCSFWHWFVRKYYNYLFRFRRLWTPIFGNSERFSDSDKIGKPLKFSRKDFLGNIKLRL